MADPLGFAVTTFAYQDKERAVYRAGKGPAVVIMSEIPGITPQVARFARYVAGAGFSVYMPHLIGETMRPASVPYALGQMLHVCISREFRVMAAHRSSPIVDWLRALANQAHKEQGGKGVGAVGMCLTGNFALAMMLGSPMLAPVLSQPSLPFRKKDGLHASDEEIAAAKKRITDDGARILGLRFKGDRACQPERFQQLKTTFGDAFEAIELDDSTANPDGLGPPHSVLTNHLIDKAGEPTRAALDRVLLIPAPTIGLAQWRGMLLPAFRRSASMSTKRLALAIVAGFVVLSAGRYLIHSVWLMGVYTENATLWRTQTAMLHHLWVIYLANLIFAAAATLIYVRGIESKPWLGQGIRFGILLALVSAVPQSMVEYFTYPVTGSLATQWIIGEGGLALLLGIVVAAICRPKATA